MKMKATNARGEVIEINDGDIVPSGFSIRVPMMLLDSVQRSVAESSKPTMTNVRVTDSSGRVAGHRPGFLFARDSDQAAKLADDSYAAMIARTRQAWQSKPSANEPASHPQTAADARAAYIANLGNAWKTR